MKEMKLRVQNLILLLFSSTWLLAQNVGINTDGSTPNPSSILDIKSTNKGLLIPRMTSVQRIAIASPANGLMVFDTDTNSFWFYGGTAWTSLAAGWALTGNGGLNSANQFLGTSDNNPLIIKVNNELAGQVYPGSNRNVGWGLGTLKSITSGVDNTAIGAGVMASSTTGSANSAMGTNALVNNTIGDGNVAIGNQAMRDNTSGSFNTANGFEALLKNTTGEFNTSSGTGSLHENTSGELNTANGFHALYNNTTGAENTGIGPEALAYNIYGFGNSALGRRALFSNTSGRFNTAAGRNALYLTSSGTYNTAIGGNAGASNTSGDYNIYIGYQAGWINSTGYNNCVVGANAMFYTSNANENSVLGTEAMYNTVTGNQNAVFGNRALFNNIDGSFNSAFGCGADVASGNLTNATAIGYNTVVNASNKIRIGNSAVTVIEGQVPFTSPSDGRFKFNVKEDVKGLDFILQLRPVTYQFDTKKFETGLHSSTNHQADSTNGFMQASYDEATAIRRTGFIAQEVEKAANNANYDFSGLVKPKTADDHYSLSYESFVVPLVKAVQELQAEVEILKAENKKMKANGK